MCTQGNSTSKWYRDVAAAEFTSIWWRNNLAKPISKPNHFFISSRLRTQLIIYQWPAICIHKLTSGRDLIETLEGDAVLVTAVLTQVAHASLFIALYPTSLSETCDAETFPSLEPLSKSKAQVEGNKCKPALKEQETNATGSEEINRSEPCQDHTHTRTHHTTHHTHTPHTHTHTHTHTQ